MAVLDSRALILLGVFLVLTQDFDRQVRDAYEKVKPVVERNGKLIDAGRRDEANDAVLAVFPEGTEGKVTEALLVQGIKAEFRHFSSTGVLPRPKAATLRAYFRELAKIVK